ncbi:MAG TPA: HNH endonuclease signature motif containing protein [Planctomycetaceae bacterium]|nr:HNH endonuclease signature motif containing protein [Planctomycetaceae bacterium]
MEVRLRAAVRERADEACEDCQRRQADSPLVPLQIEHIVPRKHDGDDSLENLALACAECNLKKSSDLAGFDPDTGNLTPLFHPRHDVWDEHFAWDDLRIVGRTAICRTTVRVLDLNVTARLRVRRATR